MEDAAFIKVNYKLQNSRWLIFTYLLVLPFPRVWRRFHGNVYIPGIQLFGCIEKTFENIGFIYRYIVTLRNSLDLNFVNKKFVKIVLYFTI